MPLNWSLVIATYQRGEILQRCLRLAVQQTRPPSQIVVVDASDDWERTRDRVMSSLWSQYPNIELVYVAAQRRSSAAQRNQGVKLATSEIVFLIDDDSLMYPQCAAEILRVYEADPGGKIVGVNAVHVPRAPDQSADSAAPQSEYGTTKHYSKLARNVRRILHADDIFVPYDENFPRLPLPTSLALLPTAPRLLMAGWGMTFRRQACLQEPFEEILGYYAYGEDSDAGYRISRHGALATAFKAKLCHVGAGTGRLDPYIVAALGALNPVVLHRIYSTDLDRSRRRLRLLMLRRTAIFILKDLSQGNWGLPNSRGMIFALRRLKELFSKTPEELRSWYPQFQKELVEGDSQTGKSLEDSGLPE
jgi:GT2 family glycosyltransferase